MLQSLIDAIIDIYLFLPRLIASLWVDLAVYLIQQVPEMEVVDPQQLINGLGGDLLWLLTIMEFQYGLTAMMTALGARFILRRIPGIG